LPPAGGVYGAAGIVDVAQGTLYAFDATAIDGFSDVVQHSAPGDPKPNLSTAITDSAHDVATAHVPIGNAMITADYTASTAGVDAVSAVLMADRLYNEFDVEPGVGAATDWVVTFPTKQFYVDPGIVDTGVHPFEQLFDETSCHGIGIATYDREGAGPPGSVCYGGCSSSYLCFESDILTFNTMPTEAGPSKALGSKVFPLSVPDAVNLPLRYELPSAGSWALSFPDTDEQMRQSADGIVFVGVPATGFAATNYINANVSPGVLSNYSAAYPHRSHASCTHSTNPQSPCP